MVVNVMWVPSWSVVLISLSVLIFTVLLLLCCVCFKNKDNGIHQLYVLDENGMKIVTSPSNENPEGSFFRRFSLNTNLGSVSKCGSVLKKYHCRPEDESANDLVDSFDVEKQFDNTTLRIDDNETNRTFTIAQKLNFELEDDNVSCKSEESRTTFYSVYPSYMRTTSVPETMRSALSNCDINELEG